MRPEEMMEARGYVREKFCGTMVWRRWFTTDDLAVEVFVTDVEIEKNLNLEAMLDVKERLAYEDLANHADL